MTETRNISALFTKKSFALSINPTAGGAVTGAGSYAFGSSSSITASPFDGYSFSSWIGNGVTNSLSSTSTVTMNQDRNISALFSINSYDLVINAGTGGSVSGAGSFTFGSTPSITASPLEGYSFTSWTGTGVNNSLSPSTFVTMNQDQNVSALFAINYFDLVINSGTGGSATGAGSYTFGSTPSITASPLEGYSFTSWTGTGINNSFSPSTFVTMNQDQNVSALFAINYFDLVINSGTGGSATGAGSYTFGSTPSITASPLEGYSFISWTGTGINNSHTPSTFVTMNQDQNVTALFSRIMLSSKILAVGREHNWYESTWFGSFYESASGWCYHSDLGWIYPYFSENSFWIWSPDLKWLWISSSTYTNSFAWSENEKNWIYLDFENSSGPRIYSYQKTAWQGFTIE
jgi:hypothetical protein